jgi:hypothetical protein
MRRQTAVEAKMRGSGGYHRKIGAKGKGKRNILMFIKMTNDHKSNRSSAPFQL